MLELGSLNYFRSKDSQYTLPETSSHRALNKYRINTENTYAPNRKATREMSDFVPRSPQGVSRNTITQSFNKAASYKEE